MQLRLDTLPFLPAAARPTLDPRERTVAQLHLGLGAFHRSHQALYTEESGDWGICAVSQYAPEAVRQLAGQDGLYSVTCVSPEESTIRVCGAIRDVAFTPEPELVVERMADPAIQVVTITVTEKGYRHDPATGRLRLDDPEIVADRQGRPARTVVGQLVAGLRARRERTGQPLTVVSCDNMSHNGHVLAQLVEDYLTELDEDLLCWIRRTVPFPCTMVDRITPATTDADRDLAQRFLGGIRDEGAVVTEPFRQWIIEDRFATRRPDWEKAGAILSDDVPAYEAVKLRMLNGTHSALAYLGSLAGLTTIAEATHTFPTYAHHLMTLDTMPTLTAPAGLDLAAYRDTVLSRFSNPTLRHTTAQVAMDGSQKLPQRLLDTVRDRHTSGSLPEHALFAVAAWMRYVSAGVDDTGRPYRVQDPLADQIADVLAPVAPENARRVCDALLSLTGIFGPLHDSTELRDRLTAHLGGLIRHGARAATAALGR